MKRILLDENLPRPLAALFIPPLEVISVHDLGWAEKKNGELIRAMLDTDIQILLTADKNLQNQQNLNKYPIKLVLIRTIDNRLKTLIPFVPLIQQTIMLMEDSASVVEVDLRNL